MFRVMGNCSPLAGLSDGLPSVCLFPPSPGETSSDKSRPDRTIYESSKQANNVVVVEWGYRH